MMKYRLWFALWMSVPALLTNIIAIELYTTPILIFAIPGVIAGFVSACCWAPVFYRSYVDHLYGYFIKAVYGGLVELTAAVLVVYGFFLFLLFMGETSVSQLLHGGWFMILLIIGLAGSFVIGAAAILGAVWGLLWQVILQYKQGYIGHEQWPINTRRWWFSILGMVIAVHVVVVIMLMVWPYIANSI